MNKELSDIYELILEATVEDNTEKSKNILAKAISALSIYGKRSPKSSDYYYLLGLCWYECPENSVERSNKIVYYLEKSILKNKYNYFAIIYLGFFYFDSKKYKAAKKTFAGIELDFFDEIDQHWRYLKIKELSLCCDIYIDPNFMTIRDGTISIEKFIDSYLELDSYETAVPVELVRCMYEHISLLSQFLLNKILTLIEHSGSTELLRKEYDFFKNALS